MARKKTYDELLKEMEDLKKDIKVARQKEKENQRKWRNHALSVIGGEVLKCFDGSDWTRLDIQELSNYLQQYKQAIKNKCQLEEKISPSEANKKIRDFEKAQQELKKQIEKTNRIKEAKQTESREKDTTQNTAQKTEETTKSINTPVFNFTNLNKFLITNNECSLEDVCQYFKISKTKADEGLQKYHERKVNESR